MLQATVDPNVVEIGCTKTIKNVTTLNPFTLNFILKKYLVNLGL